MPLESERGYHVEIMNPAVVLRRPVMPSDGKMGNAPTDGRLRAAGQVELASVQAPPSCRRGKSSACCSRTRSMVENDYRADWREAWALRPLLGGEHPPSPGTASLPAPDVAGSAGNSCCAPIPGNLEQTVGRRKPDETEL